MLDNCEHVLGACAKVVSTLVSECPALHVVVTSREPINIAGEAVYPLSPLRPDEAGRLFVARARLRAPDFDASGQTWAEVTKLCTRLDYLPLALELAAARVALMTRRAPHCWLSIDGGCLSTIDLFDGRFCLLSESGPWCEAATAAGDAYRIPIGAHVIRDTTWASMYEVGERGAVLVRPDGYVAWRTQHAPNGARKRLVDALEAVVGRSLRAAGD